jgi:hypothetical protein
VRTLQTALLHDQTAPAAIIPLYNLPPQHPEWLHWQQYYLNQPEAYPTSGNCPLTHPLSGQPSTLPPDLAQQYSGTFYRNGDEDYTLVDSTGKSWAIVTLDPQINQELQHYPTHQRLTCSAKSNLAGNWLLIENLLTQLPEQA